MKKGITKQQAHKTLETTGFKQLAGINSIDVWKKGDAEVLHVDGLFLIEDGTPAGDAGKHFMPYTAPDFRKAVKKI